MDRIYLALACVPYLLSSAYVCYAMGARHLRPSHVNLVLIVLGFVFHTLFLYERGEEIGRCPISNLFELSVFFSWGLVLNYLVLGSIFRCSVLGYFTSPLAVSLILSGLLIPGLDVPTERIATGYWLEMHASLSVLAFGTLGLAAMAAMVFLLQDYSLKHHTLGNVYDRLPNVRDMDRVCFRITLLGFLMLTFGMTAGFFVVDAPLNNPKMIWSFGVWVVYLGILTGRQLHYLSPSKFSWVSVICFVFVLLTFWGVKKLGASLTGGEIALLL